MGVVMFVAVRVSLASGLPYTNVVYRLNIGHKVSSRWPPN